MSDELNLFPDRVEIGQFTDPTGHVVKVYQSVPFERALRTLFQRVGGANGMSNDDLVLLAEQDSSADMAARQAGEGGLLLQPDPYVPPVAPQSIDSSPSDPTAAISALADLISRMQIESAAPASWAPALAQALDQLAGAWVDLAGAMASQTAEVAVLRQATETASFMADFRDPYRVTWERPGKIGSATANSVAATTLTASAAVTLSPANAAVVLSPTGTGTVTIAPATVGAINNVNIGAATRGTGAFTSGAFNAGLAVSAGVLSSPGGATFMKATAALTNGAGALAGTIANAPAVGNPTKWIGIDDAGTVRYIPAW